MKLVHTAEFAALVTSHATDFVNNATLTDTILSEFHRHSRDRFHNWMRVASQAESAFLNASKSPTHQLRAELLQGDLVGTVEHILVGEILTRVWVATLTAWDRSHNVKRAEPVARNVMLGHMLARHQALTVLHRAPGMSEKDHARVDALRNRAQRWTDLLIAHILQRFDLWEISFDVQRAKDFAEEHLRQNICAPDSRVWNLILVGLRIAFPDHGANVRFATEQDRRVMRAVLRSFPDNSLCAIDSFQRMLTP